MSFGERLKAAREEKGYTQSKLAELIGYGSTTVSEYEKGNNKPNLDMFIRLCKILDQSPNYFLQDEIILKEELLNPEDKRILDRYKSLTPHDREIVDHVFSMKPEEPTIIYRFPVYEQQAAAGAGKYGREGKYHMKDLQINNLSNQAVFGVEISGNSMEKKNNADCGIKDNATVLLNPNFDELNLDGRIVVFKINSTNEVLCKRYFKEENAIGFISDNDECSDKDKHLATGEYTIIGEVVNVINP